MLRVILVCVAALLAVLALAENACARLPGSQEEGQQIAEDFVKNESTYRYDALPGTLIQTGTTSVANGWQYTFEFDCRSAGYGNRTGKITAQVITHHTAVVTVQSGRATKAVMDKVWDMITARMIPNVPSPGK